MRPASTSKARFAKPRSLGCVMSNKHGGKVAFSGNLISNEERRKLQRLRRHIEQTATHRRVRVFAALVVETHTTGALHRGIIAQWTSASRL
jgi:hypothetical protein